MIKEQKFYEGTQVSIIIFEVSWEQFAIDLLDVKEIIQAGLIRRLPKSLEFVEGIYNYRGDIIHIINLRKKLNLNEYRLYKQNVSESTEDTQEKFIIIANINSANFGFLVDKIINVAHVSSNDLIGLSPIFQTSVGIEYIKGVVKFSDRPRILIDLNKVLSESEQISIQKELKSII